MLEAKEEEWIDCIVAAPELTLTPALCPCVVEGPTVCTCTEGYPDAPFSVLLLVLDAVEPLLGPCAPFPTDVAECVVVLDVGVDVMLLVTVDEDAESGEIPPPAVASPIQSMSNSPHSLGHAMF